MTIQAVLLNCGVSIVSWDVITSLVFGVQSRGGKLSAGFSLQKRMLKHTQLKHGRDVSEGATGAKRSRHSLNDSRA